jgi:hypothetical protein
LAWLFAVAVCAGSVIREVRGAARYLMVKGFAQPGVK